MARLQAYQELTGTVMHHQNVYPQQFQACQCVCRSRRSTFQHLSMPLNLLKEYIYCTHIPGVILPAKCKLSSHDTVGWGIVIKSR